jgi:DNA-binding LacI/PurR family transcriptional regulator
MSRIIDTPVPTVLVNSRLRGVPSSVCIDDRSVATMATQHLLDLGHRHIGMLAGPRDLYIYRQREMGYKETLLKADLEINEDWIVHGSYDVDTGTAGMQELLKRFHKSRPTGVFATTIAAAVGALKVAREASFQVPRDLSIVSVHDFWFARHTEPSLTTVRTPQFSLGVMAMRALEDRINGVEPTHIFVDNPKPELVTRGSTGPPPG